MHEETWVDRLTSRKFIAFGVGLVGAFLYAFALIDEKGLAAIVAAAGTYQIGEGLADLGQNRARVEAAVRHEEVGLHRELAADAAVRARMHK
jgi:hypothetical protein